MHSFSAWAFGRPCRCHASPSTTLSTRRRAHPAGVSIPHPYSFSSFLHCLLSQLSKQRHRVSQPANDGAHHSTQLQLKSAWFILLAGRCNVARFGSEHDVAAQMLLVRSFLVSFSSSSSSYLHMVQWLLLVVISAQLYCCFLFSWFVVGFILWIYTQYVLMYNTYLYIKLYFLFGVHRLAVEFRNTLYATKSHWKSTTLKSA